MQIGSVIEPALQGCDGVGIVPKFVKGQILFGQIILNIILEM